MKKNLLFFIFLVTISIQAGHHEKVKVAAQGMTSSEVFDLAGEMDLYVEKYESCGAATGAKHYHPYGTLVYVLEGSTTSNASGSYEPVTEGKYWFEKSNWVHGGEDPDAPAVDENQCGKMLIIRIAKKGEQPTVFVD
tara:strand:- start:607 stop:1017 length:411 start_codon:yes stop_codon:yes gene_type:complete